MDSRPSLHRLNSILWSISQRIPAGSYWRHQKSGKVYEVVCISAGEKDGTIAVVYRPAHDPNGGPVLECVADGSQRYPDTGEELFPYVVHHRPVSEWEEDVTIDRAVLSDMELIGPRFKRVERKTVFA